MKEQECSCSGFEPCFGKAGCKFEKQNKKVGNMDIENKIKVILSPEDVEQACKNYAAKHLDEINQPSFENTQIIINSDGALPALGSIVINYKGYP